MEVERILVPAPASLDCIYVSCYQYYYIHCVKYILMWLTSNQFNYLSEYFESFKQISHEMLPRILVLIGLKIDHFQNDLNPKLFETQGTHVLRFWGSFFNFNTFFVQQSGLAMSSIEPQ